MENEKYRRHVFGCKQSRPDFAASTAVGAVLDDPTTDQSGSSHLSGQADLRVSDAEREAAASELNVHFTAGRIDMDEFDERLQAVLSGRTRRDLAGAFEDLPRTQASALRGQPHRTWPPFVPLFVIVGFFVAISTVLGTIAFGPLHHFIVPWWIVPIALFFVFRRGRRGWYQAPHTL